MIIIFICSAPCPLSGGQELFFVWRQPAKAASSAMDDSSDDPSDGPRVMPGASLLTGPEADDRSEETSRSRCFTTFHE